MLVIRKEQMESLQRLSEDCFRDRVVDFWRDALSPDECPPSDELLRLVEGHIRQARALGFGSEQEIASFVGLGLIHGEALQDADEPQRILADFKLPDDERLQRLLRWSDGRRDGRRYGRNLKWA